MRRRHVPTPCDPRRLRLSRRQTWSAGLGLALVAAISVSVLRPGPDEGSPRISGAYRALSFWGDSRAYPGRGIPPGGLTRAYEYSRDALQRPVEEVFGLESGGGRATAWEAMGPTNLGGRTLAIALDPNDANTVYAGSAAGGLWKSTTGGVGAAAWQRVPTGFPVLGVSTIEFEPGSSSVFYIGTGEVYNHMTAGNQAADRRTRGSYGIGILKTTDGGATWAKSLDWSYEQQRGIWAVRVDPLDASTVWAATTEGTYKSTDAGATWIQKHAVVMAMDLRVHATNPDTVVVGCGNLESPGRSIYRTTDGGDTWSQITSGGIPTDFEGKIQLGAAPSNPDLLYASIGNGFLVGQGNFTWLFRSTDFGENWELRSTEDYSQWQGWFSHDVAVHPANPDRIFCVGISIWRSVDGGTTINQRSVNFGGFSGPVPAGGPEGPSNYSHSDHHDIVWHPTDFGTTYFATDGGVFRTTTGGNTFAGANGGYQTTQFYSGTSSHPTDADFYIGGFQDNSSTIYRGGPEWDVRLLGGDGGWAAVDGTDSDNVFATWQRLSVGRSTDGGVDWNEVSPPDLGGPIAFIAPLVLSSGSPQTLYGGSSYLFKSTDFGDQWTVENGGNPIDGNAILTIAVSPNDDDVVYLATFPDADRGRVHVTTDGGTTFTDITGTLPDRYPGDLAIDPTDDATVYLTMSGFGTSHVFKSTNFGSTWNDLDGGQLPDVPTLAVAVDPMFPEHVYVGNDIGVYLTADDGTNWAQLPQGLPEVVLTTDLSVSTVDRKLRVASHGNGAYQMDLLGTVVSAEPPIVAASTDLMLHPSAPNPFSTSTLIRFDLPRAGQVELTVYDVRGARVRELLDEPRTAGTHRTSWDGRDDRGQRVAAGAYFYRLRAGDASATGQVVLTK